MGQKKNILHLIASNFFGGPERQILAHALRLDPDRYRFLLASYKEEGRSSEIIEKARELKIPTREILAQGAFNPRTITELASMLKDEKIDILCVHGFKSNVVGRLASWMAGIPMIAISRGWTWETPRVRFYEKLDRAFLKFADHIVAVSEGQQKKILDLAIPVEKVSVIHNGIDLNGARPPEKTGNLKRELGLGEADILVMSAGRLSPEKNYGGLIDVAKLVTQKKHDVAFTVFGEGFLRGELEARVRQAGLEKKFFFPGFRKDVKSSMAEADIFVLPSFTEGLPNVVLEAYAVKKPVVATAVGGTPEVVEDGVSGFLTRPEETEKMAEHILRLAGDPDLRREMGEKGHERVRAIFGFEDQTRKYEELYTRVGKDGIRR
ncbi:MAG: glycosyltransferase [Nitrospirota bacterium]|nr:glycosyltransferase [Nitrospirota bacterium]